MWQLRNNLQMRKFRQIRRAGLPAGARAEFVIALPSEKTRILGVLANFLHCGENSSVTDETP